MKRRNALLVAAALFCACCHPAVGVAEDLDTSLVGVIRQVSHNGFQMQDEDIGEVQVLVNTETVLDGVLSEAPLAPGMYVFVQYDGSLAPGTPPQATAKRVGCYTLQGCLAELRGESFLLTGDPLFGDVVVRTDSLSHLFPDMQVTVYYNGTMAMSMPPQVTARRIVRPVERGQVLSLGENRLTLDTGEGKTLTIALGEDTLLPEGWPEGLMGALVRVYHTGSAGDGEMIWALEVLLSLEEEDGEGQAPIPEAGPDSQPLVEGEETALPAAPTPEPAAPPEEEASHIPPPSQSPPAGEEEPGETPPPQETPGATQPGEASPVPEGTVPPPAGEGQPVP